VREEKDGGFGGGGGGGIERNDNNWLALDPNSVRTIGSFGGDSLLIFASTQSSMIGAFLCNCRGKVSLGGPGVILFG
jgi:hypothetical protein